MQLVGLFLVLVLGFVWAQPGPFLVLRGDDARILFGDDPGHQLALTHNATGDTLSCSGMIKASDVLVEGTTVTQMIANAAAMREEISELRARVPLRSCAEIKATTPTAPTGFHMLSGTTKGLEPLRASPLSLALTSHSTHSSRRTRGEPPPQVAEHGVR